MNRGLILLLTMVMMAPLARASATELASSPSSDVRNGAAARPVNFSAARLYNLGNAAAQAGHWGEAILDYEQARLLSPRDADLLSNLRLARTRAGLSPEEARENAGLSWGFSPNVGAVLAWVGVLLLGLGLLFRLRFRAWAWTALLVGALLLLGATVQAVQLWPLLNQAIVTTANAPAQLSPSSFAEAAFHFHEGEKVVARSRHGEFVLVETGAGQLGWVQETQISRIIP